MQEIFQSCANFPPLSPTSFLEKASMVYGDEISIVYGTIKFTWRETHERCRKLASSLCHHLEISSGDIVATLAPNVPALYELHFAVPMAGAVLSALNPKLDTSTLASLLQQLNPKIIFVDYQFIEHVLKSFEILPNAPFVVLIQELDPTNDTNTLNITLPDCIDYNALIAMGKPDFEMKGPKNECDPISISYTSGSTGTPKGAVYSHRAAYLNSLAQVFRTHMREKPVLLWTVDMFRCNGWCFTWAMAALGGTNICLRQHNLSAKTMFDAISNHNVTHLCGSPILLTIIAECDQFRPVTNTVEIIVAGSLPPTQTLTKIMNLGFHITHAYGMTEALGPVIYKSLFPDNTSHSDKQQPRLIHEHIEADVKDPGTLKSVPWDGTTVGEVMFKGNTMMTCYFKNAKGTQEAFRGGWFRTGDFGVRHHDGFLQMMDRIKDAIIGRNGAIISSLDVERALVSHPSVLEAAAVRRVDDSLGEMVCAFVKLRKGDGVCCEEIIGFCEGVLPSYMVPRSVVFGDLPVNSTGKVQKFVLRERIKVM